MVQNSLISIITVNYNGLEDTCEMIRSVQEYVCLPYEMIVVDNGSRTNEAEIIKERFPEVLAIRSEKNLGFAGGNNLGTNAAHGGYLFFLNNDTVIKDNTIVCLKERLDASPHIGAVSPKIKFAWEPYPVQFAGYTPLSDITLRNALIGFEQPDSFIYDHAAVTPYIHGAAFMVKREVIEKAGCMPELYFLYYEELDWSERMREKGYELWYEPGFTVYHKESRSTGAESPLKTFYMVRNRLVYAVRNRKGCKKGCSIVYQLSIALPKQIVVYLLYGKFRLVPFVLKGVKEFFKKYDTWKLQ